MRLVRVLLDCFGTRNTARLARRNSGVPNRTDLAAQNQYKSCLPAGSSVRRPIAFSCEVIAVFWDLP